MSVFRVQGIECDFANCKEEYEGNPHEGWRTMVSYARQTGWRISRDGLTAYCPAHRTVAQRDNEE